MLGKLYKHEFYSLYRTLLPVYGALLLLALLNRISYTVLNTDKQDILFYGLIKGSLTTLYVVGIISMLVLTFVIIIKRFYSNCFSNEGYLTFSLPFTATNHLICKLVCGVIAFATTILTAILSACIIVFEFISFKEISNAISIAAKMYFKMFSPFEGTILIVLVLLTLIVAPFTSLLQYYFCIAFGQKYKNRIAAAVITYFVLYAIMQVISTFAVLPVSLIFGKAIEHLSTFPLAMLIICASLLGECVLGAIFFFATRYEITNKLNLA